MKKKLPFLVQIYQVKDKGFLCFLDTLLIHNANWIMLWGLEGCIFEIYQLGILFHSFFNFEGFRQHMNLQIILMILNKMYPNPKNNSITSKRKYSYHAKSWTGDFPAYISGCLIKCSIHQTARSKGLVIWSFITDPIAERNNELHSLNQYKYVWFCCHSNLELTNLWYIHNWFCLL